MAGAATAAEPSCGRWPYKSLPTKLASLYRFATFRPAPAVEQDRTSNVLSHHGKLAGQTPGEPRSDREPDWEHDHPKRIENPGRTRPADLPNRHQDCRCGSSGTHDREGGISRRVELPNLATGKVTMLFCRDSLDGGATASSGGVMVSHEPCGAPAQVRPPNRTGNPTGICL